MSDINTITISGKIQKKIELYESERGNAVCSFIVKTTYKEWNGTEKVKKATFHRVKSFGSCAEMCMERLKEGDRIVVQGRMHYRNHQDGDGNERNSAEIISFNLVFADQFLAEDQEDDSTCPVGVIDETA